MVQLVKKAGADVILLSTRQKVRREMAESLGASHTIDPQNLSSNDSFIGVEGVAPGGFDVVLECAGTKETLQQLIISNQYLNSKNSSVASKIKVIWTQHSKTRPESQ